MTVHHPVGASLTLAGQRARDSPRCELFIAPVVASSRRIPVDDDTRSTLAQGL